MAHQRLSVRTLDALNCRLIAFLPFRVSTLKPHGFMNESSIAGILRYEIRVLDFELLRTRPSGTSVGKVREKSK
jgi:hypothetical protein